jgi:hypothetical protein
MALEQNRVAYKCVSKTDHNDTLYKHLSTSDSFRLLRRDAQEEAFKLVTFKLFDAPPYEALSYCWGEPSQEYPLYIGDHRVLITQNLAEALEHLGPREAGRPQFLWIDQLCIDQKNEPERNQQVRIMRYIYQQAKRTTVWLGLDDGTIKQASRLIIKVNNYHATLTRNLEAKRSSQEGSIHKEETPVEVPSLDDPSWECLFKILQKPWFKRVWVIQEVRMSVLGSGNSTMIQAGDIEGPWVQLMTVCLLLKYYPWELCSNFDFDSLGVLLSMQQKQPLLELLNQSRSFHATDPRDKVFALLGLAEEANDTSTVPDCLVPNYAKDKMQIYQNLARYLITRHQNLNVLASVQHQTKETVAMDGYGVLRVPNDNMPSWVPRWESEYSTQCAIIDSNIFNAAAGNYLQLRHSDSEKGLTVGGSHVDDIRLCSEMLESSKMGLENIEKGEDAIWRTFESLIRPLKVYPTGESIVRAFYMTTVGGRTWVGDSASNEDIRTFWNYLLLGYIKSRVGPTRLLDTISGPELLKWTSQLYDLVEEVITTEETGSLQNKMAFITRFLQHSSDDSSAATYTSVMIPICRQRKVFTTSKAYMGIGPAAMQAGDLICVLFGGRVPFIVRPKLPEEERGQYELIGECYIHGLMEGQAFRVQDTIGPGAKWFDLH